MALYWEYLRWGAYVVAALGAWRFVPLAIVRLVAAFTRSETRHRQCMEVLRLARKDAASIPSYVSVTPHGQPQAASVAKPPSARRTAMKTKATSEPQLTHPGRARRSTA